MDKSAILLENLKSEGIVTRQFVFIPAIYNEDETVTKLTGQVSMAAAEHVLETLVETRKDWGEEINRSSLFVIIQETMVIQTAVPVIYT